MAGLGAKITIEVNEDHIKEIKRLSDNIEKLLGKLSSVNIETKNNGDGTYMHKFEIQE